MAARFAERRGLPQADSAASSKRDGEPDWMLDAEEIRRLYALRDRINAGKHPKFKPFKRMPGLPDKRPADWYPPAVLRHLESPPPAPSEQRPSFRLNPAAAEFTSSSSSLPSDAPLDRVLLAKSDALLRAETSLHRLRLEQQLQAPAPPSPTPEHFDLTAETARAGLQLTPPPADDPDDPATKLNAFYGADPPEPARPSRRPSVRGYEPPPPPYREHAWPRPASPDLPWPRAPSPEYDPAEPYRRRAHTGYRERSPPARYRSRSPDYPGARSRHTYYDRPGYDRPQYDRPPPPQLLPPPPPPPQTHSPYLPTRLPYAGRVPSPPPLPLPPVHREYYKLPLRSGFKKGPPSYKGKSPRY